MYERAPPTLLKHRRRCRPCYRRASKHTQQNLTIRLQTDSAANETETERERKERKEREDQEESP